MVSKGKEKAPCLGLNFGKLGKRKEHWIIYIWDLISLIIKECNKVVCQFFFFIYINGNYIYGIYDHVKIYEMGV